MDDDDGRHTGSTLPGEVERQVDEYWSVLRDKVEALPSVMDGNVELVVLADVLALIDLIHWGSR